MSAYEEVFKKISFGVTFNTKKFPRDASIFGVSKNSETTETVKNAKRTNIPEEETDLREKMGIQLFGNEIPPLSTSFGDTKDGIPSFLVTAIRDSNYENPTPVQMAAIPILYNRRHALICAPTGSGKTFAYLFPILCSIGGEKLSKNAQNCNKDKNNLDIDVTSIRDKIKNGKQTLNDQNGEASQFKSDGKCDYDNNEENKSQKGFSKKKNTKKDKVNKSIESDNNDTLIPSQDENNENKHEACIENGMKKESYKESKNGSINIENGKKNKEKGRKKENSNRHGLKALIIQPTKELANQIFNEISVLTRFSKIRAVKLSSIGKKVKDYKKYDILVATPQRLVELMNSKVNVDFSRIEWLILDEGDLLLHDSAKSFKEQIAIIYNSCKSTTTRCIFSATINNEIEEWVQLYLDDPITVLIGSKNSPPEAINQELLFVGQESGKVIALRNIFKRCLDPPVLIFVNSIEKAKELFTELMYDGINVAAMHSEKTETQRINLVNSFRTGKIWVLITTDLMSRGIDFKGIKTVFNYDVPYSPISYIHRIGRTGRAGVPGSAVTFYTENDIQQIKKLLPVLKSSRAKYPEYLDTL